MEGPVRWKGHDVVLARIARRKGNLVPIVLVDDGEPITSGVDWLADDYAGRSSTQVNEAARALGLLSDFHRKKSRSGQYKTRGIREVLESFAEALVYGSIDSASGACPYGLSWKPLGLQQGLRYSRHAERYCGYLSKHKTEGIFPGFDLQPSDSASDSSNQKQKNGGLLAHIHKTARQRETHWYAASNTLASDVGGRVTPFPEDLIIPMLFDGCKREHQLKDASLPPYLRVYNVRNQLAYLELFGLGIRSEELFHTFVTDIIPGQDGAAHVNLYHPIKGAFRWTPPGQPRAKTVTREEYLRDRYGLKPRNLYNKKERQWAGWKNLMLQVGAPHHYARGYWIDNRYGILYQKLHEMYIKYHRVKAPDICPYYFISLDQETYGQPWTMKAFQKAWRTSIEKIGHSQSKSLGTTPHSARHGYGQRAVEMGLDPRIIQIMMHHTSILSQARYQVVSPEQVDKALSAAQSKFLSTARIVRTPDSDFVTEIDDAAMYALLSHSSRPPSSSDFPFGLSGGKHVDPMTLLSSWGL